MDKTKTMNILGLMSGTSLDGLDIALCQFSVEDGVYNYKILKAQTIQYNKFWKNTLSQSHLLTAEQCFKVNADYGKYIGEQINIFLKDEKIRPQAIASHGHTVFHNPPNGFTTQLGSGAHITSETNITTVCDFRSLDVALGGQGAPLVPIGDKLLFGEYEACLNLGGIANISFDKNGEIIAFDICVVNMLLNFLSEKLGKAYDDGGNVARMGKLLPTLLDQLNNMVINETQPSNSLGREYFEERILPLFTGEENTQDLLNTAIEYTSTTISSTLNFYHIRNCLLTGGGAFNTFLIEKIQSKTLCNLRIPSKEIINFKEALIFAFLGYLRLNNQINTFKSVTGAIRDSSGGAIYAV
jgi:anhydro-N-acetylmuramic acid kinase